MPTTAYPLPEGIPRHAGLTVAVDGRLLALGDSPIAAWAVCAIDGPAEVEIAAERPLAGTVVRPGARGIAAAVVGGRLRFTIDRPGPLSIEIPGGKPLHLFVQPPQDEPPAGPRLRRLGAGRIHELGEVHLRDGETLFIEGGAVLRGWIRASGANVRICGHGVIDGSRFPHHWRRSVVLDRCSDAVVEGISIIGSPSWTVVLAGCDRVAVRRVNLVGWVVCSDGIDVVGSRDVVVEDCFLRDNDDCVAVKALEIDGMAAGMADVERVLVQRCVCWNDQAGNVFEIGFETRCARIRGVVFRDCDVLGAHGEGGVFTIHAGDRAEISDVLYEDIRVEHMYDKFVDFRVLLSRYSKDAARGRIHDVVLRRIRACRDPFNTVSLIGGYDADHPVADIAFEDVRIGDAVLAAPDDLHLFTRHAQRIAMRAEAAPTAGAARAGTSPTPAHGVAAAIPRGRSAFSLIELLVVISIIAVLAAILLPAIGLVKANSQVTNCASNLRQFGLAFGVYLEDNDQSWPTGLWHQLIQDYVNEGGAIGNGSTIPAVYRLCRCPTPPATTTVGAALNATYSYTGHYYKSWPGVPNYFAWQLVTGFPIIANARIVRRGEKCVLSEYWDDGNYSVGQASWGKSQLCAANVTRVHNVGSNFLFADGAVQLVRMPGYTQFKSKALTDNMWYPYVNSASTFLK